jgi:adenylosuccinate lyase
LFSVDHEELPLNSLTAVSSVDGRYARKTADLRSYFSEFALMRNRVCVEVNYLIALSRTPEITHLEEPTVEEVGRLRRLYLNFDLASAKRIKEIEVGNKETGEKGINHDVKAVEYFVKEKMKEMDLEDCVESVHFGLTSEDVTNLAIGNMVRSAIINEVGPNLIEIEKKLITLSEKYKEAPMLARTHGQIAVPTTTGKEFSVYVARLAKGIKNLRQANEDITGKLAGAVGNYNAHVAAYPNVDWMKFSKSFVHSLGMEHKPVTIQINTHDELVGLLNRTQEVNKILIDLDKDSWLYICLDYFKQKVKEGEVGSSTMPQKVNPIDFENSEGNINIAKGIINSFSELQESRLQRDLSDSTMLRALGEAFGHSIIAYKSTLKGLGKIEPDRDFMREEVINHPEVLGEAVQTILRREGEKGAYEELKKLMRGKTIMRGKTVIEQEIRIFIADLDIDEHVRRELMDLKPLNYIGKAVELTDLAISEAKELLSLN